MTHRLQVDPIRFIPVIADGSTAYRIIDSTDGKVITSHRFALPSLGGPLDTPAWFEANFKVAEAIAAALNAAPNAAIEYIRQCQREVSHVQEKAHKELDKS